MSVEAAASVFRVEMEASGSSEVLAATYPDYASLQPRRPQPEYFLISFCQVANFRHEIYSDVMVIVRSRIIILAFVSKRFTGRAK
jgi:hypothetical protein